MWNWSCPRDNIIREHHSWASLDEFLKSHEDGLKVPGYIEFPPCEEIHDYWDDGVPCYVKNCKIPYIRD